MLSQLASLDILHSPTSRTARGGRGPSGGLKCSKPALAEMVDAKGMPCPDVGSCRSPRRRREVGSATVPFVVVVDYVVELMGLKANFYVTRFYTLKTIQRERGPQGLFRTILTFHGGAVAASGRPVVVRAGSRPIQLYSTTTTNTARSSRQGVFVCCTAGSAEILHELRRVAQKPPPHPRGR